MVLKVIGADEKGSAAGGKLGVADVEGAAILKEGARSGCRTGGESV